MARDLERIFLSYSRPPSDTEESKCDHVQQMVCDAINEDEQMEKLDINVFAQGSYRNNTNVKQESDIDICVCCKDYFYYDLPDDITKEEVDIGSSKDIYPYDQYKADLVRVLNCKFGSSNVKGKNKAIHLKENTYRVEADVVATFQHRRYFRSSNGQIRIYYGTQFFTDGWDKIINWPEQNYDNGVWKNNETGRRFKRVVRIIKRLRNDMEDEGNHAAQEVSSFLIECLVWNVPNDKFNSTNIVQDVRNVLAYTFNNTRSNDSCSEWGEINELKYLFRGSQPWTRQKANRFLDAVWNHIGFKD